MFDTNEPFAAGSFSQTVEVGPSGDTSSTIPVSSCTVQRFLQQTSCLADDSISVDTFVRSVQIGTAVAPRTLSAVRLLLFSRTYFLLPPLRHGGERLTLTDAHFACISDKAGLLFARGLTRRLSTPQTAGITPFFTFFLLWM